jgi:NRPS condensation-like uncharacterized protein
MTAFEAYMWADDRPDHPMTALIEVAYSGSLEQTLFETAFADVLAQHPLLRATIDETRKRPRWVVHEDASPRIDWGDEASPLSYPAGREAIDLTREIGVRAWVRTGASGGRVVLQLHHACTDGVGVMQVLCDLLRAYDARSKNAAPQLSRNASLLATRDRFFNRPIWGRTKALLSAAKRTRTWTRERLIPLREDAQCREDTQRSEAAARPMESILHRELETDETAELLHAARAAGVTANDLLIRDLFQVLAARCRQNIVDENDCLCVCMPMNLRDAADVRMPAANKMMMSFLRRTPFECSEPDELLRSVHDETTFIKRTRRGVRLLEVIRIMIAVTGKIPPKLLAKNSFATAVLSNLGKLAGRDVGLPTDDAGRLVAGGLTIDRIITAPNGRPGTAAVLVALTYAGRLTLSLRYERDALSEEAAAELLDAFLAQLRETATARLPEPVLV